MQTQPIHSLQRESLAGVVLAGGASTRMGTDKAALVVHGRPMLEHLVRLLQPHCSPVVVAGRSRPTWWQGPDISFFPDESPNALGPMAGIATALAVLRRPILVLACDMPNFTEATLQTLLGAWSRAPKESPGVMIRLHAGGAGERIEPLAAIYHPSVLPVLKQHLADGRRSLWRLAQEMPIVYCDLPDERAGELLNLNDPDQFLAWSRKPDAPTPPAT